MIARGSERGHLNNGRRAIRLTPDLEKSLSAYACAAAAAGVSLLAMTNSAEAKIVYTPANVSIPVNGGPFLLDLNNDGIADFAFWNLLEGSSGSGRFSALYVGCAPIPVSSHNSTCRYRGNEIWGKGVIHQRFASALNPGIAVRPEKSYFQQGPKQRFLPAFSPVALMANLRVFYSYMGYQFASFTSGQWLYTKHRYLGLRFIIRGQVHYGWARVAVTQGGKAGISAILTGYAYETIPNKPIITGKTKGPGVIALEPVSLGRLGQGAAGISAWRVKK
jgi:hypothetical protein